MDTFIVRVWTPADEYSPPSQALHGKISHVESGRAGSFADGEELLAFVAGAPPGGTARADREDSAAEVPARHAGRGEA